MDSSVYGLDLDFFSTAKKYLTSHFLTKKIVSHNFVLRACLSVLLLGASAGCGSGVVHDTVDSQGSSQVLISGGRPAPLGSSIAASTVGLKVFGPSVGLGMRRGSLCSGTVIGSSFVLTAAHCFSSGSRTVQVFGANGFTRFWAQNVFTPQSNGFSPDADVALVLVPGVGSAFRVVPYAGGGAAHVTAGTFTLAGFGQTRPQGGDQGVLRYTTMSAYPFGFGSSHTLNLTSPSRGNGRGSAAQSACEGDSGGPVYSQGSSGLVLQGVISRGALDCSVMGSVTAMRVGAFAPWIQCIMSQSYGGARNPVAACSRYLN